MKNSHLSIEQLEKDSWGAPEFSSHLVKTCHELRKVPIAELGTEGLRMLISQGIGLSFILPLAMKELSQNPFAEGDFYQGDLLMSVVKQADFVRSSSREISLQLDTICNAALARVDSPLSAKDIAQIHFVVSRPPLTTPPLQPRRKSQPVIRHSLAFPKLLLLCAILLLHLPDMFQFGHTVPP